MNAATTYYESLLGAWSGAFDFAITDEAALATCEHPTLVRLTALLRNVAGKPTFATTLSREGDGVYLHTTRVTSLALPIYVTKETMTIAADGRSFTVAGEQAMPLGRAEPYAGEGEVEESGRGAEYRLPWMGVTLIQRTKIVTEGLAIVQETPFSRGEVTLSRRR